jgi:hypothetical protein
MLIRIADADLRLGSGCFSEEIARILGASDNRGVRLKAVDVLIAKLIVESRTRCKFKCVKTAFSSSDFERKRRAISANSSRLDVAFVDAVITQSILPVSVCAVQ